MISGPPSPNISSSSRQQQQQYNDSKKGGIERNTSNNTNNLRPESAPPRDMNTAEMSKNHFKKAAMNGGGSMTSSNASLNDLGGDSGKDDSSQRGSLSGRFFSAFE